MLVPRPLLGGALLVVLAASGSPLLAADQTILGKSFTVKDPLPGGDPALRSVVVVGKEPQSPNTIVGDPLANGATVEIIANGASPTAQLLTLPAGARSAPSSSSSCRTCRSIPTTSRSIPASSPSSRSRSGTDSGCSG